jgi:transcriptional regulator with GAF, ATPase, and Fis domain
MWGEDMAAASTVAWSKTTARVLVASSDPKVRQRMLGHPSCIGAEQMEACGGAHALAKLKESACDAVLLDRNLADLDAQEVAALIHRQYPEIAVSWIDNEQVENLETQATPAMQTEIGPGNILPWEHKAQCDAAQALPGMIGDSEPMREVYRLVRMVAKRDTTVLVTGETGTGKELVAEAIHALSPRAQQPFVVVNCAAIPEALLEAELFGHARGAFTGAVQARLGRIHVAQGGTLFLDEIGDLPLGMQAKLLRFLQSGEVQRLGSSDVHRVDVRVICATNARLNDLVEAKQFRMDLYYRLEVFPIGLPALRERTGDIEALTEHFLRLLTEENKSACKSLHNNVMHALRKRRWPGNVRELQHAIERAFILAGEDDMLCPEHFPIYGQEDELGVV